MADTKCQTDATGPFVVLAVHRRADGSYAEEPIAKAQTISNARSAIASLQIAWSGPGTAETGHYQAALIVDERTGLAVFGTDQFAALARAPVSGLERATCPACLLDVFAGDRADRSSRSCPGCGATVTVPAPRLDPSSDRIWTEQYGGRRKAGDKQWLYEAERRVNWLRKFVHPPARVLEIGAGTGEFCLVATSAGFDVDGVEPTDSCSLAAQLAPKARLIHATIDEADLAPETYDAVAMFHVLEHLDNPIEVLRLVFRSLRVGGVLLLEVPNGGSLGARKLGSDWLNAVPTEHVTLPTDRSLHRWLDQVGFERIRTRRYTSGLYQQGRIPYIVKRLAHRRFITSRDLLRASAFRR